MAKAVVLPKLGNSVESALILSWRAQLGDAVEAGDPLCEIETDKAAVEVECSASGLLLARFYEEGDEAPVLGTIAVIGQAGESIAAFAPADRSAAQSESDQKRETSPSYLEKNELAERQGTASGSAGDERSRPPISPRARHLAERKGVDFQGLRGSGPHGRIIERDIEAALRQRPQLSPVARKMLEGGEYRLAPDHRPGQRVRKGDLQPIAAGDAVTAIPLAGARKTIARRMLASLQGSAQLSLHSAADARALQSLRSRFKGSDDSLGLRRVTINDLLLHAVARTLPDFPELNARYENDTIYQHRAVHLSLAVDSPRALLAPVIRHADSLSLRELSSEAHRLREACHNATVTPAELSGGTFTVSNLGGLGIDSFTPILNPPQVGILGVGAINLRPVPSGNEVDFLPHISLSLTIDHQVVDGAGGARFLAKLGQNLATIDLLLLAEHA